MNEKSFEKLELNTVNVLRLLKECKKTSSTTNAISCNFYDSSLKNKAPILDFDKDKLIQHEETIRYLLGQLHAVHTNKKTMSLPYGLMNYKGENWTNDNMALYALYYLGTASLELPFFQKTDKGAVSPISEYKTLQPTFWPPKKEERELGDE